MKESNLQLTSLLFLERFVILCYHTILFAGHKTIIE